MAKLLDTLRQVGIALLDKNYQSRTSEATLARELHASQGGIVPNQWYKLVTEVGNCVGFSYSCHCRIEYQFLNALEWFRDYKCPTCSAKFDLLKAVGLEPKSKIEDLAPALANLPVRPRAAGVASQPRFMNSWSEGGNGANGGPGNAGEVVWGGQPEYARQNMETGEGLMFN